MAATKEKAQSATDAMEWALAEIQHPIADADRLLSVLRAQGYAVVPVQDLKVISSLWAAVFHVGNVHTETLKAAAD